MSLAFARRLAAPAEINFNDRIRVKLNDLGWKIHREWHRDLFRSIGKTDAEIARDFPYRKPEVSEKDGCCEFHLWEVANIFGPKLYNGCKPPFEMSGVLIPSGFADQGPIMLNPMAFFPGREVDLDSANQSGDGAVD